MSKLEGLHLCERTAALPWPAGASRAREASGKELLMTALKRELAAAWTACGAFEWAAFHYLALSSILITIFSKNLAHPARLVGVQFALATGILLLCRIYAWAEARAATGPSFTFRFWHFWRHWYPHLFFLFCFEMTGHLVHMVFPGWFDARLIAADTWITGVNPVMWIQQFTNPPLNEFMQFIYTSYFTYLLILGGILYFRKDWKSYWSVMTYSMVGYQIGYVVAACFPIQSPWFQLAGQWPTPALQGGPVTALINFIEHYGRVRGAAFPSQHVCGAVAAVWGAWAHRRRVFWVFLPMVFLMCISTVYGRYHYMVDSFGGITTGTIGFFVGTWLMKRNGALSGAAEPEP